MNQKTVQVQQSLPLYRISAFITVAVHWQTAWRRKISSKNSPLETFKALRVLQIAAGGSSFGINWRSKYLQMAVAMTATVRHGPGNHIDQCADPGS
jgi:hypothetical protein